MVQPSSAQSFLRCPLTWPLANGGHVRVLRALVAQDVVQVLGPASTRRFAQPPAMHQPLMAALAQLLSAEGQHWPRL